MKHTDLNLVLNPLSSKGPLAERLRKSVPRRRVSNSATHEQRNRWVRHLLGRSWVAAALALLGFGICQIALAQAALKTAVPNPNLQTQVEQSTVQLSAIDRQQWNLTEADWDRYEEIMRGPRRFWSPGVDPLTVLGAEARTDAERQRYAEMLVNQERARAEKELAFTRAYGDAWLRMYGDEKFFDQDRLGIEQVQPFLPQDRIAYFLDEKCAACADVITQVAQRIAYLPWPSMDLYFVNTKEDAIQHWANNARIPKELVEQGRITINIDEGSLSHLQGTSSPQYPAVFVRRGDEFNPIEPATLLRNDLYGTGGVPAGDEKGFMDRIMGIFR